MDNYENEYMNESEHLKNNLTLIEEQLQSAEKSNQKDMNRLIDSRRDMQENTVFSRRDLDRIIDITQYLQSLEQESNAYDDGLKRINKLRNMLISPYFARIDFKYEGDSEAEKIYIGRAGFTDEKTFEYNIYDWRAPVSSLFYRFEPGIANFTAPSGLINGKIELKRQYEVKNSKLEYFFDADVQIVDEFLKQLLSQNASSKMKTIVETIQKDQDMIIRDINNELLMVQGAAGSGKTSVALHRAAYLMYQVLSVRLTSNNILILSPNKIFEKYISDVLPELGEENVQSVIFEEICKSILKDDFPNIQNRNRLFENLINCGSPERKKIMKDSLEFKSSGNFVRILNKFADEIVHERISFIDIFYDDKCIATKEELKERVLDGTDKISFEQKLRQLEEYIFKIVREMRIERRQRILQKVRNDPSHMFDAPEYARLISINESTELINKIRGFSRIDYKKLYFSIFQYREEFIKLSEGIELPENIDNILKNTCENFNTDTLLYEDALAVTYLKIKLSGETFYKNIHQVVIDEAQDYYPVHYEILNKMFGNARYTILGDINQTIEKQETLSLYNMIRDIFKKKKSTLIKMYKSFRSTNEIIEYSMKFTDGEGEVENFSRSGVKPVVYSASGEDEYEIMLLNEIEECKSLGYGSIGILCKSEKDSKMLFKKLFEKCEIHWINQENPTELKGTFIMPVYMAKGLEFDAVLVADTDDVHYCTGDDKKLLYVACTRALHRLNLFHTGKISRLLEGGIYV